MVESLGWAELEVRPSFSSRFDGDIDRRMSTAGSVGGAAFGDSAGRSMSSRFSHHAATAAKVAAGVVAAAGYALFRVGQDSIAEAREAQKIGAITESTLVSTGHAANVTKREIGDLATAISLKTGIDDEAIQAGENMILSFKNIRNEAGKTNDIFNQTTQAVTDMAAFMAQSKGGEIDLKAASIQVGKALNDPIKGLTALQKVGVAFTEDQKAQITTLVDHGQRLAAQKIILGELTSEFGGAAAAGATWGEKTKVAISNVEEKFGQALLPMVDDIERTFVKKGVPMITGWVDVFQKKGIPAIRGWADTFQHKGVPAIKDFLDEARPLAGEVLPAIGTVLGTVRDVLSEAAPYAKDLVGAFNDMPDWAKKGLAVGGLGALAANKVGLIGGKGGGVLGGLVGSAKPLPVFVTNPGFGSGGVGGGTGVVGGVGARVGSLPKFAPLIPVGLSSAPGQQSLWDSLHGKDQGPMPGAQPMPADVELLGGQNTDGMTNVRIADLIDMRTELSKTAAAFKTLPTNLQSKIVLEGAPESRKEAKGLAREFDLTAKDRKTLFETSGIPEAKNSTKQLIDVLNSVPKEHHTGIYLDGMASAQSQIRTLIASIHAIPSIPSGDVPFTHGGQGGAAPSGRRTPRRSPRRTPVVLQVAERDVAGVLRDYSGSDQDLADERRRAGAAS